MTRNYADGVQRKGARLPKRQEEMNTSIVNRRERRERREAADTGKPKTDLAKSEIISAFCFPNFCFALVAFIPQPLSLGAFALCVKSAFRVFRVFRG